MLKRILSVVALCASVSPAIASPSGMLRDNHLTRVVEATGVTFKTWHPYCDEDSSYGFYQPSKRLMVVCVSNHYVNGKMDYYELGDTLRHEAIHVAQVCNGNGTAKAILSWNQILNTPTITSFLLSNVTLLIDSMLSMKHSLVLQS